MVRRGGGRGRSSAAARSAEYSQTMRGWWADAAKWRAELFIGETNPIEIVPAVMARTASRSSRCPYFASRRLNLYSVSVIWRFGRFQYSDEGVEEQASDEIAGKRMLFERRIRAGGRDGTPTRIIGLIRRASRLLLQSSRWAQAAATAAPGPAGKKLDINYRRGGEIS